MTTPSASAPNTDPRPCLAARPYDHPDAQTLVRGLYAEQLDRYGYADAPEADASEFEPPSGLFLVGYDQAGTPVACGGYRMYDQFTAEIKKMFVLRNLRGHGLGHEILRTLEDAAREAGARRIILETGVHNHEALALYRHAGYRPIPAYIKQRNVRVNRAFAKDIDPHDPGP